MNVIELRGLSKEGSALQRIDLEIRRAEVVMLRNVGSVETARLARILSLDEDGWSGQFFLLGTPVHELSPAARRELRRLHLGVVFSDDRLIAELTVAENLELPLTSRTRRAEREAVIGPLIEALELGEVRDAYPRALSRREIQLVKIVRAVAGSPAVVIADDLSSCLRPIDWERACALLWRQVSRGMALALVRSEELEAMRSGLESRQRDAASNQPTIHARSLVMAYPLAPR